MCPQNSRFHTTYENKIWKNNWSIWRTCGTLQYLRPCPRREYQFGEALWSSQKQPRASLLLPFLWTAPPKDKNKWLFRTSAHTLISHFRLSGEPWLSFKGVSDICLERCECFRNNIQWNVTFIKSNTCKTGWKERGLQIFHLWWSCCPILQRPDFLLVIKTSNKIK